MSRAPGGALALALTSALLLLPCLAPIAGGGRAAAADCAWQRHSKRVVRWVKRDGQRRRLIRVKHWWSCEPLAVPPALAAPVVLPAAADPAPSPEPEPPPHRVSVKAADEQPEAFSFSLSRPYVVAGEVTVELNNSLGQDPHSLDLRPVGSEGTPLQVGEAGPGESRVGRFELAPGTYRLWCSLPQHDEWGMNVELEVRGD